MKVDKLAQPEARTENGWSLCVLAIGLGGGAPFFFWVEFMPRRLLCGVDLAKGTASNGRPYWSFLACLGPLALRVSHDR